MAVMKQSVTYSEDPGVLAWIEDIRQRISEHRGSEVTRTDVIRWLTRQGRSRFDGLTDDAISAQV